VEQLMPRNGCLLECCDQFRTQSMQKCSINGIMSLCNTAAMS